MTRTAALLAAALAAPALAQSVEVRLTHDDADGIILVGESVTWTLEILFENYPASSGAGAANMELLADNTLGTASDFVYTSFHQDTGIGFNGGTSGGGSNGAGIGSINFTNFFCIECDFVPAPTRTNPLIVGTFEFTAADTGALEYSFANGPLSSAFVEIQISAFASDSYSIDEVAFNVDTLTIVPAPVSAVLLAPAGLVALRRRR